MEYSSNAKGNLGVTLGAIGTGLSALTGGLGLFNGGSNTVKYVTKDEMDMSQKLSAKDSEIALLKAESVSEEKMIQVYNQAHAEVAALRDRTDDSIRELQKEINNNAREQAAWNASQSVANAQMSAAIATNANSISLLQGLVGQITQTKVPNTAVCPGWGNVTITPASSTTTG